ncbi:MAG: hypothetical protein L3K17_08100 [Thermoplasmata archaeon]|nr:hypothetical protein [Thermoplasmata archaeon]
MARNGQRSESRQRLGARARLRGALITGLGLSGFIALLLIAAPIASAASVTSFVPPYTTFTSSNSNSVYSSACTAVAHESVSPTWSSTTGAFSMAGKASTSSCGGSSYTYASIYGTSTIYSPTFAGSHGGTSYVYVDWTTSVVAKAALSVSSTGANYSYASASVTGYVDAYLIDVTNGSFSYVMTTYTTLFGATFYSSGHYALTQGPTATYEYLYGTLHKGHSYEVELVATAGASVYLYGGTGSASASFNLAGANGITLTSVTVY